MTAQQVAAAYFAAIADRDPDRLRELFADDAELVTPAGRLRGAESIVAFYRDSAFGFDDLQPQVRCYLADGERVAAEIGLRMAGRRTEVADVFTVRDGRIARLAVYLGGPVTG